MGQAACKQVSPLSLGLCRLRQTGCLSENWQSGLLPHIGGGWAGEGKLGERRLGKGVLLACWGLGGVRPLSTPNRNPKGPRVAERR